MFSAVEISSNRHISPTVEIDKDYVADKHVDIQAA